ncbi:hypothetical protein M569_08051 [Genlisea aurea]|uniref:Uncharacterized protein n=1 Tax=Genlisea aurea TaxID=192259 RepID=S8CJ17_9LAMI|nr:hypothetical protein M569_08051 [Genlisea aurea]
MQVTISIITQNRVRSLSRLLNSLENAYYMGDNISIIFNMDSQVDEPTLKLVTTFNWAHGTKTIRKRVLRGGLIKSVSESWYPSSNHDFGLLLEDDIEVSPYYYLWIKYALLTYHYDPKASFPELSSISLYTPRVIEVLRERPFWNPTEFFDDADRNMPYLHQLPCSWGAVFFPKHWREFNAYINLRSDRNSTGDQVEIPRSVTNGWKRSWKKFFIEMMYLRGYVSLYPNFPNQTSFSTNHMEPGVHIQAKNNAVNEKRKDYVVPLMGRDFRELLPHGKLPIVSSLPCLNLYNELASLKDMKIAGSNLGQDVLRCNNGKEIVVVDTEIGLPLKCATF